MAIKIYKRNTAGRRNMSIVKPEGVYSGRPEKRLTDTLRKSTGRAGGKISVRHKGGAEKRLYRKVDFRQIEKLGVPAVVERLERDPNRTALIALLRYADGERRYVLATSAMKAGSRVIAAEKAPIADGNRMLIGNIPAGAVISMIELQVGKGAQIVRSAGSAATLMSLDGEMAQIKLSSSEVRLVSKLCYATLGQVSNTEHGAERIGKAGRSRHRGIRPTVRGTAMNPVDHPHGGGEGRQPLGMHPRTPWGKLALGKKTRKKGKASDKYIVKRRTKK